MANQAYTNAANQERRVKARLEAEGWTVWRTPGSKSPADLVCVRPMLYPVADEIRPWVMLVQCKNGARPMSGPKRLAFADYAAELGAYAMVVDRGMKVWTTLDGAWREKDAA